MDRLHRQREEATFTANAMAVSLMFIVGMVVLLATGTTGTTGMSGEGAVASASSVSLEPARADRVDVSDGYKRPGQEPTVSAASSR